MPSVHLARVARNVSPHRIQGQSAAALDICRRIRALASAGVLPENIDAEIVVRLLGGSR